MKKFLSIFVLILIFTSCSTSMSVRAEYKNAPEITVTELVTSNWQNDYFAVTNSTKIYGDSHSREAVAILQDFFKGFGLELEEVIFPPLNNYIKINVTKLGFRKENKNFIIVADRNKITINAISVEDALIAVEVLKEMKKESMSGVVRIWAGEAGK
ncbi:MAG: hypothetical protein JXR63_07315 [Spirochaetales bacterium]|nr:hypothetical protein [Spirochaetales bacterium]